ncbi:hypothetical protein E1160_03185 [Rhodospirillaceae bacterium RKSG073]|nr:hypothetical protein [Curvivirga aplysinae]
MWETIYYELFQHHITKKGQFNEQGRNSHISTNGNVGIEGGIARAIKQAGYLPPQTEGRGAIEFGLYAREIVAEKSPNGSEVEKGVFQESLSVEVTS